MIVSPAQGKKPAGKIGHQLSHAALGTQPAVENEYCAVVVLRIPDGLSFGKQVVPVYK